MIFTLKTMISTILSCFFMRILAFSPYCHDSGMPEIKYFKHAIMTRHDMWRIFTIFVWVSNGSEWFINLALRVLAHTMEYVWNTWQYGQNRWFLLADHDSMVKIFIFCLNIMTVWSESYIRGVYKPSPAVPGIFYDIPHMHAPCSDIAAIWLHRHTFAWHVQHYWAQLAQASQPKNMPLYC